MTGDSTIADFDDGRIGLGAGVRSAEGMICLSCFRLMRTLPQAIVSGSGALHCPLKSVAASVRRRNDYEDRQRSLEVVGCGW